MQLVKVSVEATLAYITVKGEYFQYKPKCDKNAGIRLVVLKTMEHTKLRNSMRAAQRAASYFLY